MIKQTWKLKRKTRFLDEEMVKRGKSYENSWGNLLWGMMWPFLYFVSITGSWGPFSLHCEQFFLYGDFSAIECVAISQKHESLPVSIGCPQYSQYSWLYGHAVPSHIIITNSLHSQMHSVPGLGVGKKHTLAESSTKPTSALTTLGKVYFCHIPSQMPIHRGSGGGEITGRRQWGWGSVCYRTLAMRT